MVIGLSRYAKVKGGWGRSMLNKLSRPTKHKICRRVHKQYRQEARKEIEESE